jgi:hypothetical protein
MRIFRRTMRLVCLTLLLLTLGRVAMAQEPPANVAGSWTIHSKGPDGRERTQVMHIMQQGGVITGHYEGPGQEGELEGTINQHTSCSAPKLAPF